MEENITLTGMAAVPFIVAILQPIKALIPDRFVPFAAMVIGVGWNVGLTAGTGEFDRTAIFLGAVIGLAAVGLYSGGRAVRDEIAERVSKEG
jgi:hypothetical protein